MYLFQCENTYSFLPCYSDEDDDPNDLPRLHTSLPTQQRRGRRSDGSSSAGRLLPAPTASPHLPPHKTAAARMTIRWALERGAPSSFPLRLRLPPPRGLPGGLSRLTALSVMVSEPNDLEVRTDGQVWISAAGVRGASSGAKQQVHGDDVHGDDVHGDDVCVVRERRRDRLRRRPPLRSVSH